MHRVTYISWISLILYLCFRHTLQQRHPGDVRDNMGYTDRQKIMKLGEELILETKVTVRQLHGVRSEHSFYLGYEIGIVMGKIREKYKRMMDIYREAQDRAWNRSIVVPPGVRFFKLLHWILGMEMIRMMEMDIDKLIHVLEMIPKEALKTTLQLIQKFAAKAPGPVSTPLNPAALREGQIPAITPTYQDEMEVKRRYREEWEKRNGRSVNWTLDNYYGLG